MSARKRVEDGRKRMREKLTMIQQQRDEVNKYLDELCNQSVAEAHKLLGATDKVFMQNYMESMQDLEKSSSNLFLLLAKLELDEMDDEEEEKSEESRNTTSQQSDPSTNSTLVASDTSNTTVEVPDTSSNITVQTTAQHTQHNEDKNESEQIKDNDSSNFSMTSTCKTSTSQTPSDSGEVHPAINTTNGAKTTELSATTITTDSVSCGSPITSATHVTSANKSTLELQDHPNQKHVDIAKYASFPLRPPALLKAVNERMKLKGTDNNIENEKIVPNTSAETITRTSVETTSNIQKPITKSATYSSSSFEPKDDEQLFSTKQISKTSSPKIEVKHDVTDTQQLTKEHQTHITDKPGPGGDGNILETRQRPSVSQSQDKVSLKSYRSDHSKHSSKSKTVSTRSPNSKNSFQSKRSKKKQGSISSAEDGASYGLGPTVSSLSFYEGQVVDITVVEVSSPSLFWVQSFRDQVELIMEQMCFHHGSSGIKGGINFVPQVGTVLCARFSGDRRWYRARVIKVYTTGHGSIKDASSPESSVTSSVECEVFFIDYGNKECLALSELRLLPPELSQIPSQCYCCSLSQVFPLDDISGWRPQQILMFGQLIFNQQLQAVIHTEPNFPMIFLELFVCSDYIAPSRCQDILSRINKPRILNVGETMIRQGLAKMMNNSEIAVISKINADEEIQAITRSQTPTVTPNTDTTPHASPNTTMGSYLNTTGNTDLDSNTDNLSINCELTYPDTSITEDNSHKKDKLYVESEASNVGSTSTTEKSEVLSKNGKRKKPKKTKKGHIERERAEKERAEKGRAEKERAEKDRVEKERVEKERVVKEKSNTTAEKEGTTIINKEDIADIRKAINGAVKTNTVKDHTHQQENNSQEKERKMKKDVKEKNNSSGTSIVKTQKDYSDTTKRDLSPIDVMSSGGPPLSSESTDEWMATVADETFDLMLEESNVREQLEMKETKDTTISSESIPTSKESGKPQKMLLDLGFPQNIPSCVDHHEEINQWLAEAAIDCPQESPPGQGVSAVQTEHKVAHNPIDKQVESSITKKQDSKNVSEENVHKDLQEVNKEVPQLEVDEDIDEANVDDVIVSDDERSDKDLISSTNELAGKSTCTMDNCPVNEVVVIDDDSSANSYKNELELFKEQKLALPDDFCVNFMMSHIESPGLFYIHVVTEKTLQIDSLMRDIKEHYSGIDEKMLMKFFEGNTFKTHDICCAQYSEDGEFYRAQVLDLMYADEIVKTTTGRIRKLSESSRECTKVKVLYIDFGNMEWVPRSQVFPLAPKFLDIPPMAYCCCSADITPVASNTQDDKNRWPSAATEAFANLTGYKDVLLGYVIPQTLKEKEQKLACQPISMVIVNTSKDSEVWVLEELVKQGQAHFVSVLDSDVISVPEDNGPSDVIGKLEGWDPMAEDYLSERNSYHVDCDDPGVATVGYKAQDDTRVCRNFKRGHCKRGDLCRFDHVRDTGGITSDRVEVYCVFDVENTVPCPKEGTWVILVVSAVYQPQHFYATFPFGTRPIHDYIADEFSSDEGYEGSTMSGESLETLQDSLNEYYSKSSFRDRDLTALGLGEMVVAKYTADDLWYRAKVTDTDLDESRAEVFFIDFGNKEWIPETRIRCIAPQFLHLPFQAIECFLQNLEPVSADKSAEQHGKWSEESKDYFIEYTAEKTLFAKVITSQQTSCTITVDLIDENEVNISEQLIKKGYAKRPAPSSVKIKKKLADNSNYKMDEPIYVPG